ncbi:MAG: enoyl-CoA hydratase [Hyphomicrobiaceae bacterium]
MATTTDVEITQANRIQTLRFARPEKKNALTGDMYRALADALIAGDANSEVSVHIFVGSGGIFTAGNDIKEFLTAAQGHDQAGGGLLADVLRFIEVLPRVTKPMIAAVDGPAVGIGTTMLFHCDLVFASHCATFATPFLDLGLVPEAGSSVLMPRRMGYARAAQMLLLGETFTAEEMANAGVVNAVVARDELEKVCYQGAQKLAKKPPEALALARRLMRGSNVELEAAMKAESEVFSRQMKSPEAQEAFQAFLEKRPANFSKVGS